ncbi:MAG: Ppx/GppA family phosphatase [Halanaerobiaceae bacterium]
MRFGAIDVGTNSCRMLIVDYVNKEMKIFKQDLRITRLGEGVDSSGKLSENAVNRAIAVIKEFVEKMNIFDVDDIVINGTSAIRDVDNADILIDAISEQTGCELNIISGEKEAELNYLGVGFGNSKDLIIDIGGGSTEFIWHEHDDIKFKSLNMGSVRMTERFIENPDSLITGDEMEVISSEVKELMICKLETLFSEDIERITGLGGTITTLAAIDQDLLEHDRKKIQGYQLQKSKIRNIIDSLAAKTIEERKNTNGLQPGRADVIVAGGEILYTVMNILNFDEILVSEYDLLFGAVRELIDKHIC